MSAESALVVLAGDIASRFINPDKEYRNPNNMDSSTPCMYIEHPDELFACPPGGMFKCKLGRKIVVKECAPGCPINNLGNPTSLKDCEEAK